MLYTIGMLNYKTRSTTDDNPFNKSKLAAEAKREEERQKEILKDRERRDIRLKMTNRQHEIDRLRMELSTKQTRAQGLLLTLETTRREKMLLKQKVDKEKRDDMAGSREHMSIAEEQGLRVRKETLSKEIMNSEREIARVKQELAAKEHEHLNKKRELYTLDQEIVDRARKAQLAHATGQHMDINESALRDKERIVDSFEREHAALDSEIERIKRELSEKNREIGSLQHMLLKL